MWASVARQLATDHRPCTSSGRTRKTATPSVTPTSTTAGPGAVLSKPVSPAVTVTVQNWTIRPTLYNSWDDRLYATSRPSHHMEQMLTSHLTTTISSAALLQQVQGLVPSCSSQPGWNPPLATKSEQEVVKVLSSEKHLGDGNIPSTHSHLSTNKQQMSVKCPWTSKEP